MLYSFAMKSCREICPVFIALEARQSQLQESKESMLEQSAEAVDKVSELGERLIPGMDEHPIDAARRIKILAR
jgi:hypothetical protein